MSTESINTWIVLGSANGSTNLGDDSMWVSAVSLLRRAQNSPRIITDGTAEWLPPFPDVEVLPFLHHALRRGAFIPSKVKRLPLVSLLERVISLPRRNEFARRTAAKLVDQPSGVIPKIWRKAIATSSGVIISGAGAMNDDYAPHGIYSWSLITEWAKQEGKPVFIIGQGIGPLDDIENRSPVARMIESADVFTVRDRRSQELALELSPASKKILVTLDWALLARPDQRIIEKASEIVQTLIGNKPYIAVSFHRRHNTDKKQLSMLSKLLRRIAEEAFQNQMRVLFVPNMTGVAYSDDRETADMLTRDWPSPLRGTVEVVRTYESPATIRAILGQSVGLIATRYHPLVFAMSEGVPCLGVSFDSYYDQKLQGISELFGVYGNVGRLDEHVRSNEPLIDRLHRFVPEPIDEEKIDQISGPILDYFENQES